MSKSHVSLEQKICVVTGQPYDTDNLLLDTRIDRETGRLKQSLKLNTITGWGISPEVQEKFDNGFYALVGCDEHKSEKFSNGTINPEGAYRTGEIIYMKAEAFHRIFNTNAEAMKKKVAFIGDDVIEFLKDLEKNAQ